MSGVEDDAFLERLGAKSVSVKRMEGTNNMRE
jgi:hypothetical protein